MSVDRVLGRLFPHQEGAQYWYRTGEGESSVACQGLAIRSPPRLVEPRTTFHCFSATKPVTALGVLQLVASGRVDLDASLTTYLPELPYRNGATVRQVLSHQAGLPNPMPLSWVHTDSQHADFDGAKFLERVLREHPHSGEAGRRARYSNIGFLLLGRRIEVASGLPYPDYVRRYILDVVGSRVEGSEAYLDYDIPKEGHATGYTRRWSWGGLLVALLPDAAGLRSNEGAWMRYRPFHLNGAAYGGLKGNVSGWAPLLTALATRDSRLLPAEGYDAFFKPEALQSGAPTGHSLAWFTGNLAGKDYRCHAGGGPGYAGEIRVYPSLKAASALLVNTTLLRDWRLLDRLDSTWLS